VPTSSDSKSPSECGLRARSPRELVPTLELPGSPAGPSDAAGVAQATANLVAAHKPANQPGGRFHQNEEDFTLASASPSKLTRARSLGMVGSYMWHMNGPQEFSIKGLFSFPATRAIFDEQAFQFMGTAGGLIGCLVLYGVMQERIMRFPYADHNGNIEFFSNSLFLVLCNRIFSCMMSAAWLLLANKSLKPAAPLYNFSLVSISNTIATTAQYEALKYVTFAVQTVAKSGKMLPVLLWGCLLFKKKYSWRDAGVAVVITGGCALFLLTSATHKTHLRRSRQDNDAMGIACMMLYLFFDGFTSTFQDKLFRAHHMEVANQILYVAGTSTVISFTLLVSSEEFIPASLFLYRHPGCAINVILLSLAAAAGQLFISMTIKNYGSLVFATIMTTRQVLSILLSSILFSQALSMGQISALVLLFGGLYFNTLMKVREARQAGVSSVGGGKLMKKQTSDAPSTLAVEIPQDNVLDDGQPKANGDTPGSSQAPAPANMENTTFYRDRSRLEANTHGNVILDHHLSKKQLHHLHHSKKHLAAANELVNGVPMDEDESMA